MSTLEDIFDERGLTDESASELLGVSRAQVSKIRRGKSKPSLEIAVKIENELGIPPRHWVSQPSAPESTRNETEFSGEAMS